MLILNDDTAITINGEYYPLVRGVVQVMAEIAYNERKPLWEVYKDVTIALVDKMKYDDLCD